MERGTTREYRGDIPSVVETVPRSLTMSEVAELLRDLPVRIVFPAREERMVYRKSS